MVTGEWAGTMNLPAPPAGSEVSLTTKAVKRPDGTYGITGQEIYITFGDHGSSTRPGAADPDFPRGDAIPRISAADHLRHRHGLESLDAELETVA